MRSPTRTRAPNWARSSVRSQSPIWTRSSVRSQSPIRTRSPKRARIPLRSRSPSAWSPSPCSKRLKRAQAGREIENVRGRDYDRGNDKDYERTNNKDYDRARHKDKDRGSNRDGTRESRGKDKYKDIYGKLRHAQSMSPKDHRQRQRHGSSSPIRKSSVHGPDKPRSAIAGARDEVPNHSAGVTPGSDNPAHNAVAKMKATEEALEAKQKQQKPSFELSGKLAAETNKVRGVTLLFNEPPDARKPTIRWRLYVFKAGEVLNEPLYVHRQSCYLFGRERRVADIPTDHPSCSKQHAVIQFRVIASMCHRRLVEKEESDGTISKQVRPYLMDLGSTNGTRLNDTRLEPQRYYELFEKDTIRFGNSSREYVILHENSAG